MPDQFKEEATRDLKQFETAMLYKPPMMFQQAYSMFWTLRKNTVPTEPITYTEINSYKQLFELELEPYEVEFMKALDYRYVTAFNKERK